MASATVKCTNCGNTKRISIRSVGNQDDSYKLKRELQRVEKNAKCCSRPSYRSM